MTPVYDHGYPETVQVKDTDFELVRPIVRRVSSERRSEESSVGRDGQPTLQTELRPDSPAASSLHSGMNARARSQSRMSEASHGPAAQPPKPRDGHTSMDAHRAREFKWISAMSATPEAQARKSKKIRKLLVEGVPSSVRYLVWAHLADSKARRTPRVYAQLGKRTRVAAFEDIERDARVCFPDHPHLHSSKGPLVTLLQAYSTMVPDVEYQSGKIYRIIPSGVH